MISIIKNLIVKRKIIIKTKVVGYAADNDYFYNFNNASGNGDFINRYIPFSIMISEDIDKFDYADLAAGIFVNDKPFEFFQSLGFESKTVGQLYREYKAQNIENAKYLAYMTVIIILFTFVSIFTLYLIDVYKADRQRAVCYICGFEPNRQLLVELIKTAFVFVVAFIPNLVLSIILSSVAVAAAMEVVITVPYAFAAMGIMLGVYVISIAVGMVKYIKTKPIHIINNVH